MGPKRGKVPSASTLYRVLRQVCLSELERCVSEYNRRLDAADTVVGRIELVNGETLRGQAIDGKEIRGAGRQGAPLALVSLVRHGSGTVLAQAAVEQKTNEITVVPAVLATCELAGSVTTMDALLTQVEIAQQIREQQGHYLMVVKRNQPQLYEAIDYLFQSPPLPAAADEWLVHQETTKAHGRIETHILESSTALNDYLRWPGLAQVLRRTRRWIDAKTGQIHQHVRFGITSLPRHLAHPPQLEQLWRGHWTVENKLHYVRDVSMGEDDSQLCTANAPHALATLRNAILALLRFEGWHGIPDAFRFFHNNLQLALQTVGAFTS